MQEGCKCADYVYMFRRPEEIGQAFLTRRQVSLSSNASKSIFHTPLKSRSTLKTHHVHIHQEGVRRDDVAASVRVQAPPRGPRARQGSDQVPGVQLLQVSLIFHNANQRRFRKDYRSPKMILCSQVCRQFLLPRL